ncbi:MAG: hypothetical protein P9L99_00820 [Candidatus Lernaella stagnicola]|nr:hypothetical protein [Candidatus Lernaella stagnicola]
MTALGYVTLTIFLAAMILTLLRKINLPVQTVLVLVALVCLALGAVVKGALVGWAAVLAMPGEMMGGIILHPITALLAGLFLAGALQATGGFEAFKAIIGRLQKTPLGLAGTVVILINLPMLASLPCGRILAAALLPLLFAFGSEGGMNLLTKSQLVVLIGAFARNAFGSCGPSPIGGVGQIGEGFLGSFFPTAADGILRAPQAFALMLGTALTALFLKLVSQKLYPNDSSLREKAEGEAEQAVAVKAPWTGYVSLVIFVVALFVSIFQPFGKIPVQTVLVFASILIIIIGRAGLEDLMAGIILLPVTAMISGFMAAGALAATGGFDALGQVLSLFSKIPLLGVAGMLAIFVQIQTMIPLSCSRILTAALVPVLFLFGPAGYGFLNWEQLAIVMAAYMINATTSCGPSPLGGGGMMGEGQMRAESGYIKGAYTFTAMAVMAPLAAVYMKFMNLAQFPTDELKVSTNVAALAGYVALIVVANVVAIKLMSTVATPEDGSYHRQVIGFLATGVLAGVVLALSVFGFQPLAALQGGIGGAVAAAWIAYMVPRRLLPEPAPFY